MIGLVLGETQLGRIIIKKLTRLKLKFTIIDITQDNLFKKNKNCYSLSVGQIGKAIKILKGNKCKKIIFAGKVLRPKFSKANFDFKALYYLPQIIRESKKGDAYIIKKIIKIFEKENFRIINQTFFNPELILKKGSCTKIKPDKFNMQDIDLGKKLIKDLKKNNVGQAVIIIDKNVIAIEDQKGTDSMLLRAHKILKQYFKKKRKKGILLKFPKSNQDLRIDLPTIGIKTVNKCAKIGLKGIVLKANQNIFLNKIKSIKLANKHKMFISAI